MGPLQAVIPMEILKRPHNLPKKPKSAHHQRQEKIDSRSELIKLQICRIFFAKRPKPASSHAPSVIVVNDEETSQKVTKQWTDPVTQRDKERRRPAQKKRRINQRSDTSKRTERVVENYQFSSCKDWCRGWLDTEFRVWLKTLHPYVLAGKGLESLQSGM